MSEGEILADFPDLEQEDIRVPLGVASARMKPRLAENLSPRLSALLQDLSPESFHQDEWGAFLALS